MNNIIVENGIYTTSELAPILHINKRALDIKCRNGELKARKPRESVGNNWS